MTRTVGSFSVDDVAPAIDFYTTVLGMHVTPLGDHGPLWLGGPDGHETLVYAKPDHEPATFTVLNVVVDDITQAVDDLVDRGVRMRRYDGIDADDRGIHRGPGRAIAWLEDPAGNSIAVVEFD
ncbi:VOC family protein [Salsipaludibacter albus]|uniref:VOC family protein n=1 Tax=Salsipaludibacter albus TaxID=2849650 RepID=UPI002368E672|nr:VOC family protein [Salsipaludibacter albus]